MTEDFPIKPKPTGNALLLTALLSEHGQHKICDCLALIGWSLNKARAEERKWIVYICNEILQKDWHGSIENQTYNQALADVIKKLNNYEK